MTITVRKGGISRTVFIPPFDLLPLVVHFEGGVYMHSRNEVSGDLSPVYNFISPIL